MVRGYRVPFTMSGWAYLAPVIDGYSRKVVGWSVADHMREELVIDAFRMAVANRQPGPGRALPGSQVWGLLLISAACRSKAGGSWPGSVPCR